MTDLVTTYQGLVYPWHCDHMGHMNVMWYVGKFDEATWQFLALMGLIPAWMREQNRGMVAVEQHLTYKRELLAGDVVAVRSGVIEVREKTLHFFHEMLNGVTKEISAVSVFTALYIDTQIRKACPIPPDIAASMKTMIADAPPEAYPNRR